MKKAKSAVFIDSSAVVAYQIVSDIFHERVVDIFAVMLKNGQVGLLTPLVYDEFLYSVKKILREVVPPKFKPEVTKRLVLLTNNIFTQKFLVFVNPRFTKSDMLDIPHIMSKYDLRSRDAMIVKSMQILGVKDIASFDSDFDRVKGINVI